MRIQRVVAHAFGPFRGEALELAPGMTVVSGPNEAGKSTWHAAIRAAVCGVKRGRGAGTKADAQFEDRHRPWDGDGRWEVEARLALDDGRTIDIVQDLAGKVACRATDVVLGQDVSAEIMDGTPDASRWLGLDRDAFAATICVGQAQVAAIAGRETAASLQEHMQRAAATRGTDATAAEARARLEEFRRESVGVDRVNARGPLRMAKDALPTRRAALDEARARHDLYLDATMRAEVEDRTALAAVRRTQAVEAALAARASAEARGRATRAEELATRHPSEPVAVAERDELADRVAGALHGWRSRARPEPLSGPTLPELEARLSALPAPPDGDLEPDPGVLGAARELDRVEEAIALHGAPPDPVPTSPHDPVELRELARRLRTPLPPDATALERDLEAAEVAAGTRRGPSPAGLAGAFAGIALAIGGLVIGQPPLALFGFLVAGVAGLLLWGGSRGTDDAARARLERAHAALAPVRAAAAHAAAERREAGTAATLAGLPPDPDALDRLAQAAEAAARQARERAEWERAHAVLAERRTLAIDELRHALEARGARGDEPQATLARYIADCRERARVAREAAGREGLLQAIAARRDAEAAAARARASADAAAAALGDAARAAGMSTDAEPDALAAALVSWQRGRAASLGRADEARREWHELVTLLRGGTVADLIRDADDAETRAAGLLERADPGLLRDLVSRPDLANLLEIEREELDRARAAASEARGALLEIGRDLPDVAEAEEAVADAEAELARVIGLGDVLEQTLRLLRAAEERVHRDLAPVLAAGIARWLPRVSGGAYTEASVHPGDLSVQVKEAATGRWRPALLLSEGTREQIYLLLRATMAQQLATTGETAPLLLDEVTVQADADRKVRLLEVLHELSTERQIVLFTHDDDVVSWADRALDPSRDRLVRLAAPVAAAPAALG